jgi:hypothetical protein
MNPYFYGWDVIFNSFNSINDFGEENVEEDKYIINFSPESTTKFNRKKFS